MNPRISSTEFVCGSELGCDFHSIEGQIEEAISLMEQQKQGDVVLILDLANSYEGRWWNMNESKKSILNLKFSIQRRIGTLFDPVTKFNQPN